MFPQRKGTSSGMRFHRDFPNKIGTEKSTLKEFWTNKFVEFCKRTDLHGYKYIVMEDLNIVERSFWALAVFLSIVIALYFVVIAYKWYARNPIVTVIESTQGAIWDIPFPAVTICDLNTISRKAARAFADNMTLPDNVSADFVFETLRFVPHLHSGYNTTEEQKKQLHVLQHVLDLNKISLETLFKTLSPAASCSNLMQRCMWKNTIYRCNQLFQQVLTTNNICCAFNYFALQSTAVDNQNIDDKLFQLANPRRVASCGYQTALTVLLKTNPDDYYSAMVASQGTLVFIDSAYNVPSLDSSVRMVNPSTETLIALTPERTYTTSGIKTFSPEQRQCYYKEEIKIGEFLQYSLHNCILYERMQLIKKICECVPFYFPIRDYPRMCNFYDMECLESILRPARIEERAKIDKEKTFNCLPECEHYDYPMEVAMGKLAINARLSGLPFFHNVNLTNRSLLNVFFSDLVSTRFRRDVYFNWQNFFAAFGGLFSLMLGFTLVSAVDLILFIILRVVYESQSEKRANKIPITEYDMKVNNWIKKSVQKRRLAVQDVEIRKSGNVLTPKY